MQSANLKLPLRVREPFGADQIVAITSKQRLVDLEQVLQQVNRRRASGQVIKSLERYMPPDARIGSIGFFTAPEIASAGTMMLSFGFRGLMQSGLSVLIFSTAGVAFGQSPNGSTAASVPNAASLSIQMTPDQTASIGSKVSFRVTAKKPGYVLLVDIDANGKMSRIFQAPN